MRIHCITLSIAAVSLARMADAIQVEVVTHSDNPEELLNICQGDCDKDDHCAEGLYCFQRGSNERVPYPCEGGESDNSRSDYCVLKNEMFPLSPTSSPTKQVPVPIGRTPTNAAPVAIAFKPVPLPPWKPVPYPSYPPLISFGSSPPDWRLPLGRCEGDCDDDSDCRPGLYCFQRDAKIPVPGCTGGLSDVSRTDYCIVKAGFPRYPAPQPMPSFPPTSSPSAATVPPSTTPESTESPTDYPTSPPSTTPESTNVPTISPTTPYPSDATMAPSTMPQETGVPTVSPTTSSPSAVTMLPSATVEETNAPTVAPTVSIPTYSAPVTNVNPLPPLISFGGDPPSFRLPLQICQGDCDGDDDCEVGLYCFQRGSNEPVPHCYGGEYDASRTDYCIPREGSFPIPPPSPRVDFPTSLPVGSPTVASLPALVSYGGSPPSSVLPLSLCEGDCDTDDDCRPGLICYQKDSFEDVPGCIGGLTNASQEDYCVQPVTPAVDEYTPGKLTVQKLGLLLSEGLDARIIATSGQPVQYHDGRESMEAFHLNPDAGATFRDLREGNEGGWIYVSNSEVNDAKGGVGAITFDKDGNILDYKMLLKRSSMNCGGGRTPFGTWVSCEEVDAEGQLYQVDPTGQRAPQVLTLGKDGGRFESFAFDIRNRMIPHFFVTEDHEQGCLRRFTPSNPDWENDPWSMLHGDGTVDYLFLHPNASGEFGTYEWTNDLSRARSNAQKYYRFSEGIDVNGPELFFVCKESRHMFILDLDRGTYTRKSTDQGLFDGTPDQIERVLEGSSELLYFTEEGGRDAGVHARNADGHFFTIFESPVYEDETTGLSWSPDGRIMYVAYQFTGYLFSVWRRDGQPFHQTQLDVKFHQQG